MIMFKTLIKDKILMLFINSWKGARGKNEFQSFKIVNLIGKKLQNWHGCILKFTVYAYSLSTKSKINIDY